MNGISQFDHQISLFGEVLITNPYNVILGGSLVVYLPFSCFPNLGGLQPTLFPAPTQSFRSSAIAHRSNSTIFLNPILF